MVELIEILARFNTITEDQAFRLFDPSLKKLVAKALRSCLRTRHFAAETVNVPSPTDGKVRAGCNTWEQVKIYFLTIRGKAFIEKHFPNLRQNIKTGSPTGIRRDRLYHELLVVECLLWWRERFDVVEAYTENELRCLCEIPADLRVVVNKEGVHSQTDCEVVVQNIRHQIEGKNSEMLFFTPSVRQADTIDKLKTTTSIILRLTPNKTKDVDANRLLNKLEEQIIEQLDWTECPLSAAAIATILKKDRAQISAAMSKMSRDGVISECSLHTACGTQKGRPEKLFAIKEQDLELFSDRIFALLLSKSIVKLSEGDYKIIHINKQSRFIITENSHAQRKIFYLDNTDNPIEKEALRFDEIKREAIRREMAYLFVAADFDRFKCLKRLSREPIFYTFSSQKASV